MNKALVLDKIERYKTYPGVLTTPLKFSYVPDPPSDNLTTEEMVVRILKWAELQSSINMSGRQETQYGARRSSLDIWRHIMFYRPEITLPEVMQAMYNIRRKLDSNYCHAVNRRVFTLRQKNPWKLPGTRYLYLYDSRYWDEYGLQLKHWNIKGLEK